MERGWMWAAAVVVPAALAVGQFQVNPQVNTGIYAGASAASVAYAGRGQAYGTATANGQALGSGAYSGQGMQRQYAATSIQQGSVRYNGYNNAFNQTSQNADTRQDFATSGVYAPNVILNGASGAYQSGRSYSPPLQQQGASVNYQQAGPQGQGAVNAQVNAQINAQVNGRAW